MSLGVALIGGSLSRERTVRSRPSGTRVVTFIGDSGGIRDSTRKRLVGYDIRRERDWRDTRDTRFSKKETDTTSTVDTKSNEKLCQWISCDWCGYNIQRVRDFFGDSADYERQRANISLCNKRLVWRCGAEIKRLWRTKETLSFVISGVGADSTQEIRVAWFQVDDRTKTSYGPSQFSHDVVHRRQRATDEQRNSTQT